MDTNLSVAAILSGLEAQIARQREQEAFHDEREAFHREQGARCAAELERLVQSLEAFKASAEHAADLATRHLPVPAPPKPADDLPPGRKVSLNKAVAKVVEGKGAQEPFGPREVTEEVNRRFAGRLRKTIDVPQVSVSLRWLASTRRIFRLEKGRPHWGSQYVRQLPPK
jgi:hypothetical protein